MESSAFPWYSEGKKHRFGGTPPLRKLLAVLAACFLLLGGAGCQFLWPNAPTSSEETDKHGAYAGEYTGKWCYQRLNTRMQACYAAIYEAVAEGIDADEMVTVADSKSSTPPQEYHGVKVTLPRQLFSRSEAQPLYVAFTWDNPQFFFISNTYGLTGRNADSYDSISLVFTMNAQERAAAQRQLDRALNDILADIRPGTYEYGKELTIHDAVAARCRYDEEAAAAADPAAQFPNAFSAYGALVEGRAVCEGYSRAMQLLLHKAGIECTLVSGAGKKTGVAHMWNLVTIDGRNYHVDATWDDSDDVLRHNYFNLTTEQIEISHRLDKDNIGVDTCTATEANFFVHGKTYLHTYKQDDIAAVIAQQVRLGKDAVEMRFSDDTYGNAAVFFRQTKVLTAKVNALLKDAGLAMWEYEVRGEPDEKILSLYKKGAYPKG